MRPRRTCRQIDDSLGRVRKSLAEDAEAQADETERRQFQEKIRDLRKYRDDVRFHEIDFLVRDSVANRTRLLTTALTALTPLGFAPGVAPDWESRRRYFESAEQRKQVAADCYQILLAWAEAEAAPAAGQDPGKLPDGARNALRLQDTAAALAEAQQLPVPRAFYLRRTRYLEAIGKNDDAKKALKGRGKSPRTRRSTSSWQPWRSTARTKRIGPPRRVRRCWPRNRSI